LWLNFWPGQLKFLSSSISLKLYLVSALNQPVHESTYPGLKTILSGLSSHRWIKFLFYFSLVFFFWWCDKRKHPHSHTRSLWLIHLTRSGVSPRPSITSGPGLGQCVVNDLMTWFIIFGFVKASWAYWNRLEPWFLWPPLPLLFLFFTVIHAMAQLQLRGSFCHILSPLSIFGLDYWAYFFPSVFN
jgi:hypothetical protein